VLVLRWPRKFRMYLLQEQIGSLRDLQRLVDKWGPTPPVDAGFTKAARRLLEQRHAKRSEVTCRECGELLIIYTKHQLLVCSNSNCHRKATPQPKHLGLHKIFPELISE